MCNCDVPVASYWLHPAVSMLSHFEDIKGDEKCKNWGGLGVRVHPRSSETSPFVDRAHMTSYSTLVETLRLSCTVFEI